MYERMSFVFVFVFCCDEVKMVGLGAKGKCRTLVTQMMVLTVMMVMIVMMMMMC